MRAEQPSSGFAPVEALEWDRAMSTIAHRLQSPVSAIQIYVRLLRKRSPSQDADFMNSVSGIEASAHELNRVIHTLSQARAVGVDGLDVYMEETDLSELVHECVHEARARLGDREIRLSAPDDVVASVDRLLVRDILEELLDNAARFSSTDSLLEMHMEESGDRVEISVSDCGSGIPLESRDGVFDPFAKLDPNRSGLGLGLFVARGAARAQGGDLTVHDGPDGGCRVVLSLPRR